MAIDYHEASDQGAEEIVREALPELPPERFLVAPTLEAIGRQAALRQGEHYFPHDAKFREWGAASRSRNCEAVSS
jgi:phage terminase large subunit